MTVPNMGFTKLEFHILYFICWNIKIGFFAANTESIPLWFISNFIFTKLYILLHLISSPCSITIVMHIYSLIRKWNNIYVWHFTFYPGDGLICLFCGNTCCLVWDITSINANLNLSRTLNLHLNIHRHHHHHKVFFQDSYEVESQILILILAKKLSLLVLKSNLKLNTEVPKLVSFLDNVPITSF